MLSVTAAGWAITLALLGALFAWDLVRGARRPHAVTFGEASLLAISEIAAFLSANLVWPASFGITSGGERKACQLAVTRQRSRSQERRVTGITP